MANVENITAENAIVNTRSGVIASSSNAIEKIREGIDQPGFRRAFPTLLASVTAVAAIILYWGMQQPDMTTLYSSLPEAQKSKVLDSLRNMGVEVELDPVTGDVLVPTDAYHQSRISLAAQGLPEFSGSPSDAVDDLPLGVSRSVEGLKLKQVQELELAKSIAEISSIQAARVHLALPEDGGGLPRRVCEAARHRRRPGGGAEAIRRRRNDPGRRWQGARAHRERAWAVLSDRAHRAQQGLQRAAEGSSGHAAWQERGPIP